MPDFTEAEIRGARENPKPGDVWRIRSSWVREVTKVTRSSVHFHADFGEFTGAYSVTRTSWREGMNGFGLVRRGA